jgi:hypothetical protein
MAAGRRGERDAHTLLSAIKYTKEFFAVNFDF